LCRLSVEDEWSETAFDRAPSHDGGYMWLFLLVNGKSLELRPGRVISGKWRIPDAKIESRKFSYLLAVLKPNRIICKRTNANCSSFHLRVFLGSSNPQGQRQTSTLSILCDNFGEKS
jgi:hypothetical protein